MALDFQYSIDKISDLNMWFKIQNNESLSLTDVPEIIRLRWNYFKDNWGFIKENYISYLKTYKEADQLKRQIDTFSDFVNSQRTVSVQKNPFDNNDILYRFYAIFDTTLINNINLTFEEQTLLTNKINRINSFTRGDFINIRSALEKERDILADKAGVTDEDYNRVFNRSPQTARIDLKNKDLNKMFELQQSIKAVNFILANSFSLSTSTIDPFALARQNANNEEIDIGIYASGNLVKLNYKEDLQALAKRTLGNPDKWIDIAIANGLKPPYIDEVGKKIKLISSASGNQINIAKLDIDNNLNIDRLSVGQFLLLQSDVQTFPEQRSIVSIREVPVSGEIIIELDGNPDLDRYKLNDNAYIRIFKQNTTNSGFYILIPSNEPLDDASKSETPWFLKSSDIIEKKQKVDMLLGSDRDLVFDSTGDIQICYGLDNSIQALKLKMSIEAGELRRHTEYGLKSILGSTNQDINVIKDTLTQSIIANVIADTRYAGVDRVDVSYSNSLNATSAITFSITLVVRLSGSNQSVPISFSINT